MELPHSDPGLVKRTGTDKQRRQVPLSARGIEDPLPHSLQSVPARTERDAGDVEVTSFTIIRLRLTSLNPCGCHHSCPHFAELCA